MTMMQNDLSDDRQVIVDHMLIDGSFTDDEIEVVRSGQNSEHVITRAFAAYIRSQSSQNSLEPIDTAPAALDDEAA